MEKLLLDEIKKYNDNYLISFDSEDAEKAENIQASILEKEVALKKNQRALELVNDAYELGDYTRHEWLTRKEKWKKSIAQLKSEIYELKRQYHSTNKITKEERQKNLSAFLDSITTVTENVQRNDLYRTINRLVNEKSPYLPQHAYNPADWYPWSEEAFAKATAEDKPFSFLLGIAD